MARTPTTPKDTTKMRLTRSAAHLFRRHGYHGVGLSEVLAEASAPKGSLYHHFPEGKSDLALDAATWASEQMRVLIADSFDPAPDFRTGVTTLCYKLAKLFDISGKWDACPVAAILFSDPAKDTFRARASQLYDDWMCDVRAQGERLGVPADLAARHSEHLFILLQGSWLMARARQDSDVIRRLPGHMQLD